MRNFDLLQQKCAEGIQQANTLYEGYAYKVLKRDFAELLHNMEGDLVQRNSDEYVLKEKIYIRLDKNGSFVVDDERGPAYRWGFEILIKNDRIIRGDLFEHNGNFYKIRDMSEYSFDGASQYVEKFIADVEDGIEILKTHTEVDSLPYYYYDAHEETSYKNLDEIVARVIARRV